MEKMAVRQSLQSHSTASIPRRGTTSSQVLIVSIVAIMALAALAGAQETVTVCVATNGVDSNPGTFEAPVATVSKAIQLAERQPAPAEIVVRGGTYFFENTAKIPRSKKKSRLMIRSADNETAILDGSIPIERAEPLEGAPGVYTIKGDFPTDEPPTMWEEATGQHFSKLAALDSVQAKDYSSVVLDAHTLALRCRDGLSPAECDIRMSRQGVMYGIQILRDNVTVQDLEFRNFVERRAAAAIIIGSVGLVKGRGKQRTGTFTANAVIDRCRAWNCYFAYRVYVGGTNARITRCSARNCVTGVWVSGLDTVVEHCELVNDPDWHSHKLTWDREFDRRGVSFYHKPEDAIIRNNFIKGFRTGIFSKGSPGEYVIEHNTMVDSYCALSPDLGFRVRYNIFAGFGRPFSSRRAEGADIDHNVFWGPRNYSRSINDRSYGAGPHNVFADPLFASPHSGDFRLLPGSPALRIHGHEHAGTFPQVADDYRGPPNLRVGLPTKRGIQTKDPSPPPQLPASSCYVSTRRNIEATLRVSSIAPVTKTRFRINDGPTQEREFRASDAFELPDKDRWHAVRFQVKDANGHWSAESVIHVVLRRGGVKLIGEPTIVTNPYGALLSFKADRYAWGKLDYWDSAKWVESASSKDLPTDSSRQPRDYGEHHGFSSLPLLVAGLAPDTPHRYRLSVSTALDSTVKEGTLTLSGRPKILYVSTTGEDAEARGSREEPFRTIQFALDRALPGDRVRIMPGVYFGAHILSHGGTADAPVVIEGLYPNTVTLDGLREVGTLLQLDRAPHVVLRNLNFRWYRNAAVLIRNSEGVRVSQCRFGNQYWRGGAGIVCRTLRIWDSPNFAVDHCIVTRTRYGVEVNNSPGGRILHNTFVANGVTHILWRGSPDDDIVIKYNSLNWNGNQMINIGLPAETVRNRSTIDYNNYGTTFQEPAGTETRLGKYGRSLPRPFPYLATNREFMAGTRAFVNMEDWLEYSGQDRNSIFADPKWVDPRAGRFDVAADSPNLLPEGKTIGALGYLGDNPNMDPEVVVTSPYSGEEMEGALTVEAHASDCDGAVKEVEFYAGDRRIGVAAASPYQVTGVRLNPGRHVITARAVDDRGAAVVSDEVRVSVHAGGGP